MNSNGLKDPKPPVSREAHTLFSVNCLKMLELPKNVLGKCDVIFQLLKRNALSNAS
jgi:hypothetical protein